jgi:hypothetical protein
MAGALAGHVIVGDSPQLLVHHGEETVHGGLVAPAEQEQEIGDVVASGRGSDPMEAGGIYA